MTLATKAGVDLQLMFEIIRCGRARSGLSDARGELILKRDFRPLFRFALFDKDMELALETAHQLRVPMPALAAVKQAASACMAAGQADEDMCSLVKFLERATGVEIAATQ